MLTPDQRSEFNTTHEIAALAQRTNVTQLHLQKRYACQLCVTRFDMLPKLLTTEEHDAHVQELVSLFFMMMVSTLTLPLVC